MKDQEPITYNQLIALNETFGRDKNLVDQINQSQETLEVICQVVNSAVEKALDRFLSYLESLTEDKLAETLEEIRYLSDCGSSLDDIVEEAPKRDAELASSSKNETT